MSYSFSVELSQAQLKTRARVESAIKIAEPALDLILRVGERISKLAQPNDREYYPIRKADAKAAKTKPQLHG